ncbi:MAG: TerB family tellurite resistance protein [Patiriisocius sp.]|uniref:TerB family tellurite resistance protein n=1 Tax=Patiriisocius sp. TaxID=2822396 RepID=UPI003EF15D58
MNKENQALISDLIVIAKADDKIDEAEYDFIHRIAEKMHVSAKEVNDLFHEPLPSTKIPTEMGRITHFYKLVLIMNIDDETHESEITAIKQFGLKMGIRQGVVNQMLLKFAEGQKTIPSEDILKIFKTYYN